MDKNVVYMFSGIKYGDYADYVRCANCDIEMLVPCGMEKCPICGEEGMTMWVDDDEQEVNIDEFMQSHNVVEADQKYFAFIEKIMNEGQEKQSGDIVLPLDLYYDEKYVSGIVVSRDKIRPEIRFDINGCVFSEDIKFIEDYDIQLVDRVREILDL